MAHVTPARTCLAVVLAAGEGKRMQSALPKVLHGFAGRSMLAHVLASLTEAGADAVTVVVGPGREDVAEEAAKAAPGVEIAVQADRLGTAHAVLAARASLARGYDDVLVVFADTPLILGETFRRMRAKLAEGAAVAALGFEAADPTGYGRFLTDPGGALTGIREHRDASPQQRAIRLCNAGLMAIDGRMALDLLDAVGDGNDQKEYYLTDLVEIAVARGLTAVPVTAPETEVMGVNDRIQLAAAGAVAQQRLREAAMRGGATLLDPASTYFSFDTKIGQDVIVEPNVFFGAAVIVQDNATIHAFSHLEDCTVGESASVGPYARLRPGARLARKSRIGNFVELKNAEVGEGAKVNHLSYIGDARIGPEANIGAGTITCNYDGFFKSMTVIGAGAFVGSNSSLVAPVEIGPGAYVGSGSVVTENVEADALAVARGRQANKAGWAKAFRAERAAKKAAKTKLAASPKA